jgi:hypothetical protein
VEIPSAFPKSKPSAPMRSHNQRLRAHRRYRNLKPLKGNYAPALTRSTKQKTNAAGLLVFKNLMVLSFVPNNTMQGPGVWFNPMVPGIGVQKTLASSIPRFPRIGAAAGKILELCNALDEVSRTPQDCESRCNSKGYHRTSIAHAKCTVPVDAELYM